VDLQSRLTNCKRPRHPRVSGQGATVEEALKINAQLSDVGRQIERSRVANALNARTTFSTITVDCARTGADADRDADTHAPDANLKPTATPMPGVPIRLSETAVTVQTKCCPLGDALIWFAVVALPYLLIPLAVFVVIRRVGRK
jgi:hypothetical protein